MEGHEPSKNVEDVQQFVKLDWDTVRMILNEDLEMDPALCQRSNT